MRPPYIFPLILLFLLPLQTLSAGRVGDVPADSLGDQRHDELDEVVVAGVAGPAHLREVAAPINYVSAEALRVHQSLNIVDAISRQPGMSQVTTGSGIAKPVIRGLGYNRVLVVSDGIRQEGQQWGDEHGLEVDGQAVHSVEILKGPASLMYGSDALAGVVVLGDAPVLPEGKIGGEFGTGYQSNNGLIDYTLNLAGHQKDIVWSGRWSQRWAHDFKTPLDGYVPGSGFREKALNAMMGLNKRWGTSRLKFSYFHLTPGMTEVEDDYAEGSRSYDILAPFQQVHHYKAVLTNTFPIGDGLLKTIVGYQQNRRQEFEEAEECELDFRLQSLHYDLRYVLPEYGGWRTNVGIAGMFQRSDNFGEEVLIPAYGLFDVGGFVTVCKAFHEQLHFSGGLRYDHRGLHSKSLTESDELGQSVERFLDFRRSFDALSGSVGLIYNFKKGVSLKVNAARGFRAPNMSELGSNGVHEGTFRYELGNSQLKAENSWQIDLGADYTSRLVTAQVALFANRIGNYIFLQRQPVAIAGTPAYQFTQGKARLLGGEARVVVHPIRQLHIENTFSYVNSQQLNAPADARYLPMTPAPRWLATLHGELPLRSKILHHLCAEVETDVNFRQNHVMLANDTETPTPAYTLLNLMVGADIRRPDGHRLCNVTLSARNVLDKAYQSHLSRLKYADTLPLTGREGFCDMGRNIALRVMFYLEN